MEEFDIGSKGPKWSIMLKKKKKLTGGALKIQLLFKKKKKLSSHQITQKQEIV